MTIIGIDIGGTNITIGSINDLGQITSRTSFATKPNNGFDAAVEKICSTIHKNAQQIEGIGIGCTGPVDPIRGTIHNPHTLPTWDNCDLVTPLRQRFGVPVKMENDADAAALGEFTYGAGQATNPMAMVTFGTGIGFAAIVDGKIYRGTNALHPEMGHVPVSLDGPACYCGTNGCFESLASGTAIDAAGRKIGLADARSVFVASKNGNTQASAIMDRAVQASAQFAWILVHSFLPAAIVLGGGIMDEHFDLFAKAMSDSLDRSVMLPHHGIQVLRASLGNDAGFIGAACLLKQSSN